MLDLPYFVRMPKTYKETEVIVQKALAEARDVESPDIKAIAAQHAIPYLRLWRRFNGTPSRSTRPTNQRKLNEGQEKALIRHLKTVDGMGSLLQLRKMEASANYILNNCEDPLDPFNPPLNTLLLKVGGRWMKTFIDRREELSVVRQKPIEVRRALATNPITLKGYFNRLYTTLEGVVDADIWNLDETGFC